MSNFPDPFQANNSQTEHAATEDAQFENFQFDDNTQQSQSNEHSQTDAQMLQRVEDAKNHALISYIFMVIGIFTGFFWILGAIWAMVKKDEARNTPYYDHYSNIISTFWWGLLWTGIGIVTWVLVVGIFITFIAWVWAVYRVVKGLARITSDQPYNAQL